MALKKIKLLIVIGGKMSKKTKNYDRVYMNIKDNMKDYFY